MITKTIILSLVICLSVVNCAPNDEVAAEVFLKETNDKLIELLKQLSETRFLSTDSETGNETSSENESEYYDDGEEPNKVIQNDDISQLCDRAGEFNYNEFKNQDLKTAFQHIHLYPDPIQPIDTYNTIATTANICSFQNKTNCDLTIDDVSERIRKSNDPEELKYYWNEWRSKNQESFKAFLTEYVETIKSDSKSHNVSPSLYLFKSYHDEHFIDEMEKVVNEIQPFYQQLHAFVRSILIKEYGTDVIPKSGLIPAHLFEKVLVDAWNKKGIFSNLITENNLINMAEVFLKKDITARQIVNFANDFFEKMGFDDLPKEFWEKRVKQIDDIYITYNTNCYASIHTISSDIYLKFCKSRNMRKFLQMHGYMAQIHYANQKKKLPFAYFESYELEYGVTEAAILSAMSTKHMDSLGLIKDTNYGDSNFEMARLLHLSIHSVMNIPIYYVHTKIINDLVSENVALEDINTHYWTLMKKYAGVSPPFPINEHEFTFPQNFYLLFNTHFKATEFISEVMGYQIYESLCNKSGHKIDLHKCDFSESTEAGDALKEMMSMGSKKPWREVLSVVTGTTTGMSAKPIVHYFSTLQNWILERNSESGATVGWALEN